MTAEQRKRVEAALKAIWERRGECRMEDAAVRKLSNENLAFLLRWWSHQDRYWNAENPPLFTEEPPKGYEAMIRESNLIVPAPRAPTEKQEHVDQSGCAMSPSVNEGHQFKIPAGGKLTPRQAGAMARYM